MEYIVQERLKKGVRWRIVNIGGKTYSLSKEEAIRLRKYMTKSFSPKYIYRIQAK